MSSNNTMSSNSQEQSSSSTVKKFQFAVDTGIHTVEGNRAGSRAALLEKKRQQDLQDFEQRKRQIQHESSSLLTSMESKFVGTSTSSEEKSFRERTVGLVSAADFKKLAATSSSSATNHHHDGDDDNNNTNESSTALLNESEIAAKAKADKKERKTKLREKKKMMSTLSFVVDDDVGEEEEASASKNSSKTRCKKDDTVDTSFLPDRDRDEQAKKERQRLEKEWKEQQEVTKQERLEIVYSYWDGSGHRRTVVCRKGDTIGDFLEQVRKDLCREFRELTSISADALIYVKEDLIIPQDLTFYDLLVTKARGKSGPLFHFDVHDDVRIGAIDSRVEKDESHPGKVVERRWYDRNKHIFPASRWEVFDPAKDYGSYTIGDRSQK